MAHVCLSLSSTGVPGAEHEGKHCCARAQGGHLCQVQSTRACRRLGVASCSPQSRKLRNRATTQATVQPKTGKSGARNDFCSEGRLLSGNYNTRQGALVPVFLHKHARTHTHTHIVHILDIVRLFMADTSTTSKPGKGATSERTVNKFNRTATSIAGTSSDLDKNLKELQKGRQNSMPMPHSAPISYRLSMPATIEGRHSATCRPLPSLCAPPPSPPFRPR